MGGLLGGAKGYVGPPLQNYWGGLAPPGPPSSYAYDVNDSSFGPARFFFVFFLFCFVFVHVHVNDSSFFIFSFFWCIVQVNDSSFLSCFWCMVHVNDSSSLISFLVHGP